MEATQAHESPDHRAAEPADGSTPKVPDRGRHLVAATLVATCVSCLFYGLDRTRAALSEPGFDPLMIVESARIDYFWRIGIAAFLAVTAFFAVLQWARAAEPRWQRPLWRFTLAAVGLSTLLSAVFP